MTPRIRQAGWTILVLLIVAAGYLTLNNVTERLVDTERAVAQAEQGRAENAALAGEALDEVDALRQQLIDLGETPVVPPTSATSAPRAPLTGPQGPAPTFAQVSAAVRLLVDDAVLAACDGDCTGPAGEDSTVPGPPGPAGSDSTVPGPRGPAGADSTVPGPRGPAGQDGRGIESTRCGDDDGRWTVTYTDGTSFDAGACRTPLLEVPGDG